MIQKLFANVLLKKGKKTKSEKIVKKILIEIKKKTKQKPIFILSKCIENLSPKLKTISIPFNKKKKKKNLYFLMFLNESKQIKTSIHWLFLNSNLKNIVDEIINTSKYKSKTILLKKNYYRNIKKLQYNLYY